MFMYEVNATQLPVTFSTSIIAANYAAEALFGNAEIVSAREGEAGDLVSQVIIGSLACFFGGAKSWLLKGRYLSSKRSFGGRLSLPVMSGTRLTEV